MAHNPTVLVPLKLTTLKTLVAMIPAPSLLNGDSLDAAAELLKEVKKYLDWEEGNHGTKITKIDDEEGAAQGEDGEAVTFGR